VTEEKNPNTRRFTVSVALTAFEWERFAEVAGRAQMTRSAYCRELILRDLWDDNVDKMRNPNPYTW